MLTENILRDKKVLLIHFDPKNVYRYEMHLFGIKRKMFLFVFIQKVHFGGWS